MLTTSVISAGKGTSAVRAAAYRHAATMTQESHQKSVSYEGKAAELVHSEIAVPEALPEWADKEFGPAAFEAALAEVRNEAAANGEDLPEDVLQRAAWARVSERLWNSVENGENRLNNKPLKAQYARSLTIALPVELDREDQITAVRGYVRETFASQGMVADWVLHDKDDGNPHVHVMLTTREIGGTDWGNKQRDWNARSLLVEWRVAWAQHANVALERAGFDERVDHRSNAARGIYLGPEGHDPHVADHARLSGALAREELRCQEVRRRNAVFLREHPEHILVVVQGERAVFTEGDIRMAFQKRMVVDEARLKGFVAEVMASDLLVRLIQASPDGHAQYVTSARASQVQRLEEQAREMAAGRLVPTGAPAATRVLAATEASAAIETPAVIGTPALEVVPSDPFETGTGPIVLDVVSTGGEEPAEPLRDVVSSALPGAAAGGKDGIMAKGRGPTVEAVREALSVNAEDLFRRAFGEPVSVKAAEWRSRESSAIAMQMRGRSRGLWIDHRSGEGGDLLDIIADLYCGAGTAKADFPRVMEAAARYAGLSGTPTADDMAQAERRRATREEAAVADERKEAQRKAALVRSLVDMAQPVDGSPAERYLLSRGITRWPDEGLAYIPAVHGKEIHSPQHGALVVWARDDTGAITGGQRILLNDDGTAVDADVRKPSFGTIGGSPARFAARVDNGDEPTPLKAAGNPPLKAVGNPPLIVAEGPESALSAWLVTGHETWAVFGASGFKDAPIPKDMPIIFAPDRDAPDSPAGKAFRKAVAQHLAANTDQSAGTDLRIAQAPEPSGSKHDFNDTLQRPGPARSAGVASAVSTPGTVGPANAANAAGVANTADVANAADPAWTAGFEAVERAIEQARPVQALLSPELSGDQHAAALAMLTDAPLTLVKGHAGTGKTFALNEVARVWQERGYEVLGGAASGKATQELSDIGGMRTASLAAWEARWSRGETLPRDRFVFVMDEAGMVGAGQWARIADRVAAMGGKLIAVGDPEQLQPVSDLPGWDAVERAIMRQGGSLAVMNQVRRQRDAGDRAATQALARGGAEIAPAIRHYLDKGVVHLDKDVLKSPVAALAEAYYTTGNDRSAGSGPMTAGEPAVDAGTDVSRIALAYTNRNVWALNEAIRKQALARGVVDRNKVLSYGDIERIDRSGERHKRIKVLLELGPGDRVMLTRPHRELDLPRSSFGTVAATREHEIDLYVDGSTKSVTIDLNDFRDIDYGYAATIHKSQGLTVDHAFVLGHGRMHRHAVYVALSRHRESVTVFGHEKHLERPADLIRLAQTPGHLSVDMEDAPDGPPSSMVAGAEILGLGARGDWSGSGVNQPDGTAFPVSDTGRAGILARSGVTFAGDGNLMAVAERTSGLLAADYVVGDPILKEDADTGSLLDVHGYIEEPGRVIEALMQRRSVIRADDVAGELSRVVAEPETFLRLFREAMAYSDLVVLSQDGHDGEGRVYSTGTQLRSELAAVDLGTRLALADAPDGAPEISPEVALTTEDRSGLTDEQIAAVGHGLGAGRLRLIRGDAGSGKTRVAVRLADIHERHGWQVIGLSPSGAGLDALREASAASTATGAPAARVPDARTLRQFTRELRDGRLRLDPGTLVVLDDAGRLGGREAGQLLEDIEASGAKLVALLDEGIQVPLDAGPVMRAIEMRVGSVRMEAMQGRSAERAAALRLVAAGHADGIAMLRDQGVIHCAGTAQAAAAALAERYVADRAAVPVALAWSRSEVDMLTAAIRKRLDAVDRTRARFDAEKQGGFAGLKPGDRIRFMGSTGIEGMDGAQAVIFAGRRADGQLLLRFEGRNGSGEAAFDADRRLPEWRFAFADTIHGTMGRAHDSVHMLASPGMSRQVLAAGLNLHLENLAVTVPVEEERVMPALTAVLRRDASAVSVVDYGFDMSLGAREAQRVALREPERRLRPERGHRPERGLRPETGTEPGGALIGSREVDPVPAHEAPESTETTETTGAPAATGTPAADILNRSYLRDNPDHVLVLLQSDRSVFTEGDIREALRLRLAGDDEQGDRVDGNVRTAAGVPVGADASVVEEAFARVMASGQLVELHQTTPDGKVQYVTKVRARELQNLETSARQMAQGQLAGASEALWDTADSNRLSGDQRAAAKVMLSDTRLTLVKGHAGTGKTFTLKEVAREWRDRGYEVLGGAPSARATQALDSIKAMRTGTLASWEARWSRGDIPKRGRFVFVMDEAGMVGAGQWSRIAGRVAAMGGKLIAVGDPEQLQPVSDLPGWEVAERAVEQANGSLVVIGEVKRQRDEAGRAATQALARGGSGIDEAVYHYADTASLRLGRDVLDDPVAALAASYYTTGTDRNAGTGADVSVDPSAGTDPMMEGEPAVDIGTDASRIALAYTNREVWELNGAIRAQALECGVVESQEVRSYGMIERIDQSGADSMSGANPMSGVKQKRITVPLELGPGDRVMLTRPHRELGLPRSSFGTVAAAREHEIDLYVDGSTKSVTIDLNEFRDIDYGYAATIHKSQGLTVDHALVLGHGRMHRHAVYVALSRHRESVTVFGHRRYLRQPEDLIRLAHTPGHLSVDMADVPDGPPSSMVAGAEVLGLEERGDWLGSGVEQAAVDDSKTFAGDGNLMAVAERVSGLLAADHVAGDPVLKEGVDPRGIMENPGRVIETLMQRRSIFRADDVAGELSRIVAEPETFLRLFRQAMAYSDLVVLSQDGHDGEGCVYSTRTQLRPELAAVDLGTRLALEDAPDMAPEIAPEALTTEDRSGLTGEQASAVEHGLGAGRLRLIRGDAGTGKTRVAVRLADIHERHGWRVIGLSPSGAGLDALREASAASTATGAPAASAANTATGTPAAGVSDTRTLRQFTRQLEEGRLRLDPGTLVVLDDAGRLGSREAGRLLEEIDASGAKLVALMDEGVQVPLEAGPVFQAMEKRIGSARMEAMQGRTAERAEALRLVAAGNTDGIAMLQDQDVLQSGGTAQATVAAVAERYVADPASDRIALAWSRSEVDMLTAAIRKRFDAVEPDRARFEVETEGSFAGLRPGDRIRFAASTPWSKERPPADAPPRIRPGDTAEFLGRDKVGRMHLRMNSRTGIRDAAFAADAQLPAWHFAFASTIHGAMGRAHDSVHMLASPGMNRQVLAAGMNLHLKELTVTVPCADKRLPKVMEGILRRDAGARSVTEYGFDTSLGAREALRGHVRQDAADATSRAVERLREIAGLDARSERAVLPGGLGAEVLAEVIGAMILHEGAAPQVGERLAVEHVVGDMSDPRAWRQLLRQVPSSLPAEADVLARKQAGCDGEGRLLATGRLLARGALVARSLGEERIATLFERGLVLYGRRTEAARLLGRVEDLVPPRGREDPPWPDPNAGTDPADRDGLRQVHKPAPRASRRGLVRWRPDIARLLEGTPRSEEVIARQVIDDMAGLFGLGRLTSRKQVSFYASFRAGQRFADALTRDGERDGRVMDSPGRSREETVVLDRPAAAMPDAVPSSRNVDIQPAEPRIAAWERPGPWHKARPDARPVPGRDYAGLALQLAQAVSERVPIGDPVHDMDLPYELQALVWAADPGPANRLDNEAVLKRVPTVPELGDSPHAALAAAVGKALAKGPVDDLDDLRRERAAILEHLEAPDAERLVGRDFGKRLRAFTHIELWAMHEASAQWPDSLPPRNDEQRKQIMAAFRDYGDRIDKETMMEQQDQNTRTRGEMVKKMTLGGLTVEDMKTVEKVFTQDEILALRNPGAQFPDSLPQMDATVRKDVAETLQHVVRERIAIAGSAGEAAAAPRVPRLSVEPEYEDQALQLACVITDRVESSSRVHRLPLQVSISHLLKKAAGREDLPPDQVEKVAREIARDRATLESRINFAREVVAKAPQLKGMNPEFFNENVFLSQLREGVSSDGDDHPLKFNGPHVRKRFASEVDARISSDIASGLAEPLVEEKLVARMSLLTDRNEEEQVIAQALDHALRWGRPVDAEKLKKERSAVLKELATAPKTDRLEAEALLTRLYRGFTYAEISSLADPQSGLPDTMPTMDDNTRHAVAKGFDETALSARYSLSWSLWEQHAVQHAPKLFRAVSMSRGMGMSMS